MELTGIDPQWTMVANSGGRDMSPHLHDISYDDAVDKLWGDVPSNQGSFGCMFSQISGTVVLQHTPIRPKRGALCRHDENKTSEKMSSLC